jgi:hypothetical protein
MNDQRATKAAPGQSFGLRCDQPIAHPFETWLNDFVVALGRYIAPAQADKFLHVYREQAQQHWRRGLTPLEAVEKELL